MDAMRRTEVRVAAAAGALLLVALLFLAGRVFLGTPEEPGAVDAGIVVATAGPGVAPQETVSAEVEGTPVPTTAPLAPADLHRAAVEARDGGEYGEAARLFADVAAQDGPLAPFARLREAQMLLMDDRATEAAAAFDAAIADLAVLPVTIRTVALSDAATAYEDAGRIGDALGALGQIEADAVSPSTLAATLNEHARILREQDDPAWVDVAVNALLTDPTSTAAIEALDWLEEGGHDVPQYTAAFAEYRARRNEDAAVRFRVLLNSGTLDVAETGAAWFYLGAIAERLFDREGALAHYASSLEADPAGGLADDARYWRGRVLEELGRVEEAAAEYDLVVQDYPNSTFAEESRLRAAVALGLAGYGKDATARLAQIARDAHPSAAAEAARWHQVLVSQFGAPPADGSLSSAAADPTSYTAAFEYAGHAVEDAIPAFALDEQPAAIADDRAAVDVWMDAQFGPGTSSWILVQPEVDLAWVLAEAGEDTVARGLLLEVLRTYRDSPHALLELAYAAREHGLHDIALSCASIVLARVSPQERLQAPPALLALAYPVPFLDEATEAAAEFEVPVLLLYALVRQESAFNPQAGSSAGAFGLTQVVAPTGAAIAGLLGDGLWTFEDLARPEIALRFGAYYLGEQLDAFDGHVLAALSAYNGGPGNARRWLDAQAFGGPDGYVYTVDFTETRLYLEHVIANYAMYRYLYAGAPVPSLPHGG